MYKSKKVEKGFLLNSPYPPLKESGKSQWYPPLSYALIPTHVGSEGLGVFPLNISEFLRSFCFVRIRSSELIISYRSGAEKFCNWLKLKKPPSKYDERGFSLDKF